MLLISKVSYTPASYHLLHLSQDREEREEREERDEEDEEESPIMPSGRETAQKLKFQFQ